MEGVQLNKNVLPADAVLVAKDRWSELYKIGKKFIAVGTAEKGRGYLVGLAKPTMQFSGKNKRYSQQQQIKKRASVRKVNKLPKRPVRGVIPAFAGMTNTLCSFWFSLISQRYKFVII
jgi:hypothetical protein